MVRCGIRDLPCLPVPNLPFGFPFNALRALSKRPAIIDGTLVRTENGQKGFT